jgi:hypothetical protein
MNTVAFGKLHVQTGLRFEDTQMDTFGYNVTLTPTGVSQSGWQIIRPTSTSCPVCRCATD